MDEDAESPGARSVKVCIVGPCAAGKSVLADRLRRRGVSAYGVAQEHTAVPDLYRHQSPDVIVYLDVEYETAAARRELSWPEDRHDAQKRQLGAVRAAADLYVPTDQMTESEVEEHVAAWLLGRRPRGSSDPGFSR